MVAVGEKVHLLAENFLYNVIYVYLTSAYIRDFNFGRSFSKNSYTKLSLYMNELIHGNMPYIFFYVNKKNKIQFHVIPFFSFFYRDDIHLKNINLKRNKKCIEIIYKQQSLKNALNLKYILFGILF